MQSIKGFVSIQDFVNNIPGATALLGELSTWSLTYSRIKADYSLTAIPGYDLTIFSSKDVVTGDSLMLTNDQVTEIITTIRNAVAYSSSHVRPYVADDYKANLTSVSLTGISNVTIGDWVDDGSIVLPQYIQWSTGVNGADTVKIWLSDLAFQNQYDEYEILVVPPIANIDDFFSSYSSVLAEANTTDISKLLSLAEDIKGGDPETYIRAYDFDFFNPQVLEQHNLLSWGVVIYGKIGDNIDTIKDAMVNHILANSAHTANGWSIIFPEIFKRTEFVVLPRWDQISISNLSVNSALYGNFMDPVEVSNFCKDSVPFYTPAYIGENIRILPFDYKAIMLNIINGPDNLAGNTDVALMFPDYIPVSTTITDFNRMSIKTRDWLLLMQELLIVAETANIITDIPPHMRRLVRGDILFFSALFDNVNYLVAAKNNTIYGG